MTDTVQWENNPLSAESSRNAAKGLSKLLVDNMLNSMKQAEEAAAKAAAQADAEVTTTEDEPVSPTDITLDVDDEDSTQTDQIDQVNKTAAEGLSKLLVDNMLNSMKRAEEAAAQQTEEVRTEEAAVSVSNEEAEEAEEAAVPVSTEEAAAQQPEEAAVPVSTEEANKTAAEGLSKLLVDSIITGMRPVSEVTTPIPSKTTDVKKTSIFKLLNGGEPIQFEYGVGIIDSKVENKYKPTKIRHYFLYKPPKISESLYYSITMNAPFNNKINNLFAFNVLTNKNKDFGIRNRESE